ncbi:MAG: choice-of-anchor D domain-containing protein [bacterium]
MKRLTTILLAVLLIFAMSINLDAKKRVLIECFTGTSCGYCGSIAKPKAEEIIDTYNGDVFVVEVHCGSGDPFNTNDGLQLAGAFEVEGIPSSVIDRAIFNVNNQNMILFHPNYWVPICPLALEQEDVVDVKLLYQINENTRELTATIEAVFLQSLSQPGELRFNVYIVENNLIYYQAGQGDNYNHKRVLRKMLGGPWGTTGIIPSSVKAGDTYTHTYTYTLDASWKIDDLDFYGCVNEYHASDANYIQILNSINGQQGTPYAELTTTGPTISAKPAGETFSKSFNLRNVTNEQITFRINDEVSARTPANWTWQVVTPNGIVSKSEKTQATEITINAGMAKDFTIELTPGTTLGIGDLNIEIFNKYDPSGQRVKGFITVVSSEIENLQVDDNGESQYSLMSNMSSAGLTSPVQLSTSEFEATSPFLNDLNILVWNCGEKGSLVASEALQINTAINEGVNVFMLGTIIANSTDNSVKSMLSNAGVQFLKQAFQGAGDGKINIIGYQGDAISNGFDQPCTLINYLAPALKAVGTTAQPFLRFKNVDTVVAVHSMVGETKVIVLGLNPFAIGDTYARNNLIGKCFEWLQGNGPSISCSEDLSFTSTEAGQTSEQTLTLENKGKSPLNITDVEVEYDYSNVFSVKGNKSFTIPAGETYDLVMEFKPSYAVQYDSWIRIYSNAENAPIKQVNLEGRGTQASAGPVISLNVEEINFVDVAVGGTETKSFRINNTGNQALNVTNITVPGAYAPLFTIDPTAFTVAAGASQDVEVTFNPSDVLSVETNLTISSNNKSGAVQMPINANSIVGVDDGTQASALINLFAGPNPFSGNSNLEFTLNGDMSLQVEIDLIDATGRTVKEITNKTFEPGTYNFSLNSSNLSSGTYYIVAKTKDTTEQLQIVVVK